MKKIVEYGSVLLCLVLVYILLSEFNSVPREYRVLLLLVVVTLMLPLGRLIFKKINHLKQK